jgi:hypothetical protein
MTATVVWVLIAIGWSADTTAIDGPLANIKVFSSVQACEDAIPIVLTAHDLQNEDYQHALCRMEVVIDGLR